MSIENELKKEGIEVISKVDTLAVNSIAKNVARRIYESFPELSLDESVLFSKLAKLNMYKAKIPNGMAEASYFYKNQSIYFNEHIDDEDLEEFAIHECIHYLQERLDRDGNIQRMGLCSYINSKAFGLSLNEAAVQYTASYVIGIEPDFEKYYNITLYTPSPSYYPLECALLNEILYFTGKDLLFKSTIYSTYDFKNQIISLTCEDTYDILQKSFDDLLELEENVIKINNQINSLPDGSSKYAKLSKKLDLAKQKVTDMFFGIQKLIIEDFFGYEFNKISNLEELEAFRNKLYKFSDIIGSTDGYDFFDSFYKETMNKLEHKYNILENGGVETALAVASGNSPFSWIHKLLNFIFKKEHIYDNK